MGGLAPNKWIFPKFPLCPACGRKGCMKPIISRKKRFSYMYVWLAQLVNITFSTKEPKNLRLSINPQLDQSCEEAVLHHPLHLRRIHLPGIDPTSAPSPRRGRPKEPKRFQAAVQEGLQEEAAAAKARAAPSLHQDPNSFTLFDARGHEVNVLLDVLTPLIVNLPRGDGYVEFKTRADAEKALLYMDGTDRGNVIKAKFTLPPRRKVSPPPKPISVGPKRDVPPRENVGANNEKDMQQRPRESSPRRKPPSPGRKRSPIGRRGAVGIPPYVAEWTPPHRRGDTPPRRRPLSPVRRRSPSPVRRRIRSPVRVSPRRGRGSPVRKRSPIPPRRRNRPPPPRRGRSKSNSSYSGSPSPRKACKRKKKQQQQREQLFPFTKTQIASHCLMH
ncbi:Arginine/serine-rich protein 45 [Acorus calamus]|uniref:Arginine/serine-rich protein 45 n=1 Tax=Acorus calamus TaxID=4465 RepID=A0AAV9C088_ACOCL|nr:Arginine/serine-rich protein 45 [Acorus calamus]